MGKEPFPPARGTGAVDTLASEEQVAECRWGYQCSVCLLAGDLLCCEVRAVSRRQAGGWRLWRLEVQAYRAGVAWSVQRPGLCSCSTEHQPLHPVPATHPAPPIPLPVQHPDVCGVSVHPECTGLPFPSGPYICMNHDSRELKTRVRRRASSAAMAGDLLGSDEETTEDEEGGSGGGGGGSDDSGGRKKKDADSEATISEGTESLDSSATEDEGTSSKRRRKR